ncbi:MAG: DUF6186 family protein [Acidimicrobiales bacterium]
MSAHWVIVAGWIAIVAGIAAVEVLARVGNRRVQGLGRLAGAIAHSRSGKVALLLGWGWLGWHLFVR